MTWSLIAHTSAAGDSSTTLTTPSIDTTGADLICVTFSFYFGFPPTLSDNKSNSWSTAVTASNVAGQGSCTIAYVQAPTVGSGHTFTITGPLNYASIFVEAFSVSTGSPLDQTNTANSGGGNVTSQQPGSITPGQSNELIISGLLLGNDGASGFSVDSSMIQPDAVLPGASEVYFGAGMAYLAQGAAATINPTWSWTTGSPAAVLIASFKADAGTAVGNATSIGTATGVGRATARVTASSSGTGAATGVGRAFDIAVGSAAGTGTASAVGRQVKPGVGSASGTGVATGVGRAVDSTTASASGTGTASGVGRATDSATASASGIGTATAVGRATKTAIGNATGTGVATGVASSYAGAGQAAGTGTASGVGRAIDVSVGSASGTGTASAVGRGIDASIGASIGTGTSSGVGRATKGATGSSIGTGVASAVGCAIKTAIGNAAGVGTATGIASAGIGAGHATGVGTATGVGISIVQAIGNASGVGQAIGHIVDASIVVPPFEPIVFGGVGPPPILLPIKKTSVVVHGIILTCKISLVPGQPRTISLLSGGYKIDAIAIPKISMINNIKLRFVTTGDAVINKDVDRDMEDFLLILAESV